MARAHERMTQADLAEAHAAVEQPREAEAHSRDAHRSGAAAPAAASHAAGRAQAQQLQALSRAELVCAQLPPSHPSLSGPGSCVTEHVVRTSLRRLCRWTIVTSVCLAARESPGRLLSQELAMQCLWLLTLGSLALCRRKTHPMGFCPPAIARLRSTTDSRSACQ